MKLAYRLEAVPFRPVDVPVGAVRRAEALGYHSVWSAEAYGTDALTPLAYIAALTSHIKLGTAIAQVAARPPTTLAMAAMSIDAMAGGGRVILGLGLSGPQIVEGWYGQPWGKPNVRLRDYLNILRQTLDREAPVAYEGQEISLPYRGPGALGQGKALRSILHPARVSRSGSRPGASATSNSPRNSPTAGCRWVSARAAPAYAAASDKGTAQRSGPPVEGEFDVFGGLT